MSLLLNNGAFRDYSESVMDGKEGKQVGIGLGLV